MRLNSEVNPSGHATAPESIIVALAFLGIVGYGIGLPLPGMDVLGSFGRPTRGTSSSAPISSPPSPAAPPASASAATVPSPVSTPVVIVAGGDIACDVDSPSFNGGAGRGNNCREMATATLIGEVGPDAVLALGDNQYEDGAAEQWLGSYDPSWGRFRSITYPVVGNHEYLSCARYTDACSYVPRAAAYAAYFGATAGPLDQFWYSFDLGTWHVVALNSNCTNERVACGEGSAQDRWLRADLAAHPSQCSLAFFHHARFSSGQHGDDPILATLYRDLYQGGVDVVLAGHDHNYERTQPLDPDGQADAAYGIRNFVVGTGGRNIRRGTLVPRPITEAANDETLGILTLTLEAGAYAWEFLPIPGKTFTDTGRAACH